MQGVMTAIGGAPPQGRAGLDNGEVERTRKPLQAGDRRRSSGEAAADHANIWARAIHLRSQDRLKASMAEPGKNRRPLIRGGGLAAEGTIRPLYQSTCMRIPKPLIVALCEPATVAPPFCTGTPAELVDMVVWG